MEKEINKGLKIYIIKRVFTSYNMFYGYDETEYFTDWIFSSKDKAIEKCKEFNEKQGYNKYTEDNYNYSLKFKVIEFYVID